jgi:hypothetical protein
MTVNRHEVAVFQNLVRMTDTVHTGDAEFTRDDRTVDQHSTPAFDNGARKRNQVCHCRLDRFADEDLTLSKTAEVVAPVNAANRAGGNTG